MIVFLVNTIASRQIYIPSITLQLELSKVKYLNLHAQLINTPKVTPNLVPCVEDHQNIIVSIVQQVMLSVDTVRKRP